MVVDAQKDFHEGSVRAAEILSHGIYLSAALKHVR